MANEQYGLDVSVNARDNVTLPLKKVESSIIRFVGAVSASLAALRIALYEVTVAGDLQTELINVQKTTDFADSTIKEFSKSLVAMSKNVNISAKDLAKIAAIGGQLGLGAQGSEALLQFTDSASRMASVLDVAVEDAGNGIAKITNIFQIGLQDAERIASAFNELSNRSTASGSDLLDIVQRIGDAGGTINLTQSLGLAATGRDLGQTLETIGTSFVKIFSRMQTEAEDFGKLVGVSTKEWASIVETDGIAALKLYLAALRELRSEERARAIEQLSGGGKIFSLVNKLTQDTNNDILNKDLAAATEGWISGTSAIEEQRTVLKGFQAQTQILKNELDALAISLGDKMLPALTGIVLRMQDWLNDPKVVSGITTMAEQLGQMAVFLSRVGGAVADLNVNWGNLIPLLGLIAAAQLAKLFANWFVALKPVASGLNAVANIGFGPVVGWFKAMAAEAKLVKKEVTELGTAQAELNRQARAAASSQARVAALKTLPARTASTVGSFVADKLGLTQEYENSKANAAAKVALEKASAAEIAAIREANSAKAKASAEYETFVIAAEAEKKIAIDAKVTALGQAEDVKITESHALSIKRQTLSNEFYTKQHIREANARLAVTEATSLEEQNRIVKAYEKSSAASQRYYRTKIAEAETASVAVVATAERTAQAEIRAAEAASITNRRLRLANVAAARAEYTQANLLAQESSALRATTEIAANAAGEARMLSTGRVIVGVVRGIGKAISAALGIFLWATLIASFLELFGLTKGLANAFFKLTDSIGITSKATRELREENRRTTDELKRVRDEAQALNDEYLKLIQTQGILKAGSFTQQVAGADGDKGQIVSASFDLIKRSGSALAFDKAQQDNTLKQELDGIRTIAEQTFSAAAKKVTEYREAVAEATTEVDKASQKLAEFTKKAGDNPNSVGVTLAKSVLKNAEDRKREADLLLQAAKTAEIKARALLNSKSKEGQIESANLSKEAIRGVAATAAEGSQVVSATLNDITQKYLGKLAEFREKQAAAVKEAQALNEKATGLEDSTFTRQGTKDAARAAAIQADAVVSQIAEDIFRIELAISNASDKLVGGELDLLNNLKTLSLRTVVGVQDYFTTIGNSVGFSGELLKNVTDKPKPTGSFAGGGDTKKDIARARFRLRQAELEADYKLVKQGLQEVEAINEDGYQRGLIALQDYLATKHEINVRALDAEIALKQAEADQAEKEAGRAKPKSSAQLGLQADKVRALGEVAALRAQKDILQRNEARERVAIEQQTNDAILERQAAFLESYGNAAEAARIRSQIEARVARAKAESELVSAQSIAAKAESSGVGKDIIAAWEAVAAAEFNLKTINITIADNVFRAGIGQAKKEIEDALALGTITPDEALVGISDLASRISAGLAPGLDLMREKIRSLNQDDAALPGLIETLRIAELGVKSFEDEIRGSFASIADTFKKGLTERLDLGLLAPASATKSINDFAKSVDLQLVANIKRLQAAITVANAKELPGLQGELAQTQLEAARLRDTMVELHGAVLNTFNDNTDIQQRLGLLTALEAGELKAAAARQSASRYEAEIVRARAALARDPGNQDLINGLNTLILKYAELKSTISDVAVEINTNLKAGLTEFFTSTATGVASLGDAFKQLGRKIFNTFAEANATALADSINNLLPKGEGSIGAIFSKFITPKGKVDGSSSGNALFVKVVNIAGLAGTAGGKEGTGSFLGNLFGPKKAEAGAPAAPTADNYSELNSSGFLAPEMVAAATAETTTAIGGIFSTMAETSKSGAEGVQGLFSEGGFLSNIFSGLKGFLTDTFGSILDSIVELFSSSGGSGGGGGSSVGGWVSAIAGLFGYAEGGYTGDGGKYQPKGVVHGGEYVFDKLSVGRIGLDALRRMHLSAKGGFIPTLPRFGYAEGGLVSLPTGSAPPPASSPTINASTRIINMFDMDAAVSEYLNTRGGERAILNIIQRNPRAVGG